CDCEAAASETSPRIVPLRSNNSQHCKTIGTGGAHAVAVALADGLSDKQLDAIERATRAIGVELFARANDDQPTVLERRWWDDRIMAWAMRDESVKAQMFRFIDVLPMLDTSEAVTEHLHEYFDDVRRYLPSAARLGLSVARPGTIAGRALAIAARRNALGHARRFI